MKYNKVPSITESLKKVASSEARNMSALPAMRFMSGVVPSRRNTVNGNRKPNRVADKKIVGEIDWNNFAASRGSYKNFDLISKKESYNVIVEPVEPSTLFLDLYPNAAAAFAFIKLRNDYAGPAIRVRRSDDAEQDIGFVNNELDTAALLSFVGAGDGFISTWYDQSGNGNDAIQVALLNQPKIYDSVNGIVLEGDNYASDFDGVNDYLETNYFVDNANISFISIYKNNNTSNGRPVGCRARNTTLTKATFAQLESNSLGFDGAFIPASIPPDLSNKIVFAQKSNTNAISYINNVENINDNISLNNTSAYYNFGNAHNALGLPFSGKITMGVFYEDLKLSDRAGMDALLNSIYKIYWDGSQTGLLDDYPNAAAAYSLRALNSAYTGPAIKVRRSNNDEQDIGLLYDGSLDTAALLSFVGAGDGSISTWYDQSGNGNNINQLEGSKQSRIVIGGALSVNPQNSLPAVNVGGTNIFMETTTAIATKNLFSVGKLNGLVSANYITFSASPFSGMYYGGTGAAEIQGIGLYSVSSAGTNSLTGEDLNTHLANFYHNGSNYLVSKDSDSSVDLGSFAQLNTNNVLGRNLNAPTSFNGLVQEVIIYSTGDDSNNEAIKSNINSHYTIY